MLFMYNRIHRLALKMTKTKIEETLQKNIELLAEISPRERKMAARGKGQFPSLPVLRDIIQMIKVIVFPDFYKRHRNDANMRLHYTGVCVDKLYHSLAAEIKCAMLFHRDCIESDVCDKSDELAMAFISELPEIKRLLYTDVQAIYNNDPAVDNYGEVILCYPTVEAMTHYRVAHALLRLGIPVIPRILTELAHSATGIDIHPGAEIDEYFAIDHGTGVVIGETCIIGKHVTLYQGVTLGAKSFTFDDEGHPINLPRHPILEDNVTVYSNSSILGRITVGKGSIIGGNVWLTNSVPAGSRIVQQQAVATEYKA